MSRATRAGPSPAPPTSWCTKISLTPPKAVAMLKYFDWCYQHGGDLAAKLDYVPLPKNVVEMVEATWAKRSRPAASRCGRQSKAEYLDSLVPKLRLGTPI